MWEPYAFFYSSGDCVQHIKIERGVYNLAFNNDSTIMVGKKACNLITLDADTGETLQVFEEVASVLTCIAISTDDLTVVSGEDGEDGSTIKVWDLPTAKLRMTLKGHEWSVRSVAISPTGEKVASGSCDRTVCIWSLLGVNAGKLLFRLYGHTFHVSSVVFTSGAAGQQVISGSMDRRIRVWNVDDGENVGTINVGSDVLSMAVNSSGDKVVCGCADCDVYIYNLVTRKLIYKMGGHTKWVRNVKVTPDDQHIISGSDDGTIIKWAIETGRKLTTLTDNCSVLEMFPRQPGLFSDGDTRLHVSGRIVNTSERKIVYTVNQQTRVETREDIVILLEEEIVVTTIKASDSSKAGEWKYWILAVQRNLSLPKQERLKTGTGIMTRYKSDWLQVININESAKVDFLPKYIMNLIMCYIYK